MTPLGGIRGRSWVRKDIEIPRIGTWCVFGNVQRRTNPPPVLPTPSVPNILPRTTTPPPTGIGPRMLDRLEAIYQNAVSIAALRAEIEKCDEDVKDSQQLRDGTEFRWLHLKEDSRMDPVEFSERTNKILDRFKDEIEKNATRLGTLKTTMKELDTVKKEHWIDVRNDAYHYFSHCLAADFKTDWSLSEEDCRDLRVIIDEDYMIMHTRSELGELHSKNSTFRHERNRANKQADIKATRLDGDLSRVLDRARKEKAQADLDGIESEIRGKEDQLGRRQERHREHQDSFCAEVLEPWLSRIGRITIEMSEPDEPDNRSDPGSNPEWQESAEPRLQSLSNRQREPDVQEADPDGCDLTEMSPEQQYVQLQGQLEQLQQEYGAKQHTLRIYKLDHFATFPNANEASYEAFVDSKLSSEAEAIGLIEQQLVSLRQTLIKSGRQVPRSPNEAPLNITGGGIRKRARTNSGSDRSRRSTPRLSPGERDTGTGKLDRWRVAADEALARSNITPSPGKSLADLSFRSKSDSMSAPSDEEMERYLERSRGEYDRERTRLRERVASHKGGFP
ncbi:hypothetical protein PRZ48_011489 [Zasmidium cellare]|uniref:Uncharacterized protein n=1 Tax=Zasmidium cellare TaxID=395010 RepID=A0ABR0E6P8_ZASCE|nr:hypothetical protein PRZ48_011489 [Zasmidium cellare]